MRKLSYDVENIQHTKIPVGELFEVFPEGLKLCKAVIKDYKENIRVVQDTRQQIVETVYKTEKDIYQREKWTDILIGCVIDFPIQWYEFNISKLNRIIALNKKGSSNQGSLDLNLAKQIPISNFLEVNSAGFARCVWHNEKTGSLKYYPKDNRVHCFGCGRSGDVIDVVRQINNCSLTEAIKLIK
jgi:hypothetical protein